MSFLYAIGNPFLEYRCECCGRLFGGAESLTSRVGVGATMCLSIRCSDGGGKSPHGLRARDA